MGLEILLFSYRKPSIPWVLPVGVSKLIIFTGQNQVFPQSNWYPSEFAFTLTNNRFLASIQNKYQSIFCLEYTIDINSLT